MDKLQILKEKSELVKSAEYQKIRQYQIETIVSLSNSDIDEKELKGMLKLIRKTDLWNEEYEKKTNK